MKWMLPVLAVALVAGCSADRQSHLVSSSSARISTPSSAAPTAPPVQPGASTSADAPTSASPPQPGQCSDDALAVTNSELGYANTLRHVFVYFKNTSAQPCTLTGYPGADLVTAAGGVLIHVPRRPAAAAHHLTLNPGDVGKAEVQAHAIDTATNESCPREGTLVVTPPNGTVPHTLPVSLPICSATVSSVT